MLSMQNSSMRLVALVSVCACATTAAAWLAITTRRCRGLKTKASVSSRSYSDGAHRGRPRMIIGNPDRFAAKWRRIASDGWDRLLVISDYDQTMTPQFMLSGKQATSSHGLVLSHVVTDPVMQQREQALFQQYYPIEVSPTLTREEKTPHMIDWWNKAHALLVECKLTRKQIEQVAALEILPFRDGVLSLLATLEQHNVPTMIFSGGLYHVIHAMLDHAFRKQGRTTPSNVHVVSNMMQFDADGVLEGFQGNLIHCYNKNATAMLETPFWKQCKVEQRRNVVLIGDSRGDAEMAQGLDIDDDRIIRVGLLNLHVEEALDEYLELYDVVLTDDASLDAVETLLPAPTSPPSDE